MTTTTLNHVSERRYPPGVFVMFFLQLLLMVGFSMIFSLLVLYCTHELKMDYNKTYTLNAAYNALIFALSVPGGYLGERYLGYRFATLTGFVLATVGLFVLIIKTAAAFYWGLAIFSVATGLMVPCTFVLLGRLYHADDARRESGFTIAYIGMNVGSFIASVSSGYLAIGLGYSFAFFVGAIFSLLSVFLFLVYRKDFKKRSRGSQFIKTRPSTVRRLRMIGLLYLAASIPVVTLLLDFANLCNILLIVSSVLCALFIVYIALKETPAYRNKLFVFLILNIVSVAFWLLYALAPSALTIFTENNVNKHLFGFLIPTATFTGLNPFFIITIGPLLSGLWMYLNYRHKKVSTTAKFAIGIMLMGLGYLVLMWAIRTHNTLGVISAWWIVLSYLFQTVGELFVGPIGYSMVGELVPPRLEGVMMGVWQLSTGVAAALSEYAAKMTEVPSHSHNPLVTNPAFSHMFGLFGGVTLVIGVLTALMIPFINRAIKQGVKRSS